MTSKTPSILLTDFYKWSHFEQYAPNTELVYSTLTPRSNKYFPVANEVVVFGLQAFFKKLNEEFNENFFNQPKDGVIELYKKIQEKSLSNPNPKTDHVEALHDLGYLPIEVRALPEGSLAPIRVPVMTIQNTLPEFFWVTNFLETYLSANTWQSMTSATLSHQYRKLLDKYAIDTTGSTEGVDFQAHDFSMRGMSSLESAVSSGAAHLISFKGTDTIPAIWYLMEYYNADLDNEFIAGSIPATEHSVMCSYGETNEFDLFKRLITEVYPSGFFSVVSDTWDFWKVVTEYLPALKAEIMNRDGRVVIRPDSGDPVEILTGSRLFEIREKEIQWISKGEQQRFINNTIAPNKEILKDYINTRNEIVFHSTETDTYVIAKYADDYIAFSEVKGKEILKIEDIGLIEALYNIFGGEVNDKGYKVLDTHIGAIYGDSITLERAELICERLKEKGFASTNVVFGVGSYSFQYNTRDTLGFAIKATYAVVDSKGRKLFKDPKTDDGTKKSQKGAVLVVEGEDGKLKLEDGYDLLSDEYKSNMNRDVMEVIYLNGELTKEDSLSAIRERLAKNTK